MSSTRIELVKADALRRLRLYLQQKPALFQRKAKRDEAIRGYLAEVVQARLMAVIDGQVLPAGEELQAWFDDVLNEAVESAGRHADVAAAAEQHRDALYDIVRAGFLAEVDRRQRRWEAAGMGGAQITPEMLAEEEEARQELREAAAVRKLAALPLPHPTDPSSVTWQDISVIFLSDERVQVKRCDQIETLNYAEFGFADGRNGKPDRAWIVLRELSKREGVLPKPQPGRGATELPKDWDSIGKRIQTGRLPAEGCRHAAHRLRAPARRVLPPEVAGQHPRRRD